MKIFMITPVWGEWHIRALLDFCLPSLLAPGNLPELARRHQITYRIDTRASDLWRFRHPVIDEIRKLVDIQICPLLPEHRSGNIFEAQHERWLLASEEAARAGAYIWTLSPDIALSDGSLRHVAQKLDMGCKTITWTWCRVVEDTIVPAILDRYKGKDLALSIPSRELVKMALQHLHPVMAAYLPDSKLFPHHPEIAVWPVRGQGLAVRVLSSVNFIYDPVAVSLTKNHLCATPLPPAELEFVTDSDQLFGISLAPLGKDIVWHLHERIPSPTVVARWWIDYDSPVNNHLSSRPIRWHVEDCNEDAWRAVERQAEDFLIKARFKRDWLRIWNACRELKREHFAAFLAAGVHLDLLPPLPPSVIVLSPEDNALQQGLSHQELDRVLGDADAYKAVLSRFILTGDEMAACANVPPAAGDMIRASKVTACSVGPGFMVCAVDKLPV